MSLTSRRVFPASCITNKVASRRHLSDTRQQQQGSNVPLQVVPNVFVPRPDSGAFWHNFAVGLVVQLCLNADAALQTMWNVGGCTFVLFVTACALTAAHWLRVYFDVVCGHLTRP